MPQVGGSVEDGVVLFDSGQIQRDVWRVVRAHVGQCRSTRGIDLRMQLIFEQQEGHESSICVLLLEIDMPDPIFKTWLSLKVVMGVLPMRVDVGKTRLICLFLSDHDINLFDYKIGTRSNKNMEDKSLLTDDDIFQ